MFQHARRIAAIAILTTAPAMLADAAEDSPHGSKDATVKRLSEPVSVTDTHEIFGAPLDPDVAAIPLGDLLDQSDAYTDREVYVTTKVSRVCQKKGCFFIAQDGERIARVTFRDYAFFVPTDTGGKTVTLSGTLVRERLDDADAEHLAADLGDSAPAAVRGIEYRIVATAVAIPRD